MVLKEAEFLSTILAEAGHSINTKKLDARQGIRLEGKLTVFDCGGPVSQAQRGKIHTDLLLKFEKLSGECDGISKALVRRTFSASVDNLASRLRRRNIINPSRRYHEGMRMSTISS